MQKIVIVFRVSYNKTGDPIDLFWNNWLGHWLHFEALNNESNKKEAALLYAELKSHILFHAKSCENLKLFWFETFLIGNFVVEI